MLISEAHKAIFIHNQKTAGISLSQALTTNGFQQDGHAHESAEEIMARGIVLQDYYSFGFVRNPWARLVSWYVMISSNPDANHDIPFWNYHRGIKSFDDFLTRTDYITEHGYVQKSIVKPQTAYFMRDGKLLVNQIFRYEQLDQEVVVLEGRLGVKLPIPHLNKFKTYDYKEFYTPESRELVTRWYASDLETFGYTF